MTVLTSRVEPAPDPRDDWAVDAVCVEALDPRAFDPDAPGAAQTVARAWCDLCPVEVQCFAAAAATRTGPPETQAWGMWGGRLFEAGRPVD